MHAKSGQNKILDNVPANRCSFCIFTQMKRDIVNKLVCPDCSHPHLDIESFNEHSGLIVDGRIICRGCANWYRIEQGVADLLPAALRQSSRNDSFAERFKIRREAARPEQADNAKQKQIHFFETHTNEYEDKIAGNPLYTAFNRIYLRKWTDACLKTDDFLLDLGAGTGKQDFPLAERKIHCLCVDICEEMLLKGRQQAEQTGILDYVTFIVGDAEKPPAKDESMDACILLGALHHLPNPERAVASAAAKLKPGGHYYSNDPHNSPIRFLFDWLMRHWKLYDEEASDAPLLSESQLKHWMAEAGLQGRTQLSIYLPPHLYIRLGASYAETLLLASDKFCRAFPGIRRWAGLIVAEGFKPVS